MYSGVVDLQKSNVILVNFVRTVNSTVKTIMETLLRCLCRLAKNRLPKFIKDGPGKYGFHYDCSLWLYILSRRKIYSARVLIYIFGYINLQFYVVYVCMYIQYETVKLGSCRITVFLRNKCATESFYYYSLDTPGLFSLEIGREK